MFAAERGLGKHSIQSLFVATLNVDWRTITQGLPCLSLRWPAVATLASSRTPSRLPTQRCGESLGLLARFGSVALTTPSSTSGYLKSLCITSLQALAICASSISKTFDRAGGLPNRQRSCSLRHFRPSPDIRPPANTALVCNEQHRASLPVSRGGTSLSGLPAGHRANVTGLNANLGTEERHRRTP